MFVLGSFEPVVYVGNNQSLVCVFCKKEGFEKKKRGAFQEKQPTHKNK